MSALPVDATAMAQAMAANWSTWYLCKRQTEILDTRGRATPEALIELRAIQAELRARGGRHIAGELRETSFT